MARALSTAVAHGHASRAAPPVNNGLRCASFFRHLGDEIERRWRHANHDERVFPELAMTALLERLPAQHVRYFDLVEALLFENVLPPQPVELIFGQPPIVAYSHPRFFIEVLCWMEATTTIHQHAFSGAFHVLQGSSVHTTFDFDVRERVNSSFLLGALRLKQSELLATGDTRAILPGAGFIHGLFHLDAPSISVVVRTRSEPEARPQYDYLPPCVAIDPFVKEPLTAQRAQLLTMLLATSHAQFTRVMDRSMAHADLPAVFELLRFAHLRSVTAPFALDPQAMVPWIEQARARFGDRVDALLDTVIASTRVADIQLRRSDVHDPDHRFLLALLMNLPTRSEIFRLVRERHREDPLPLVLRWLRELTREVDGDVTLLDVVVGAGDGESEAVMELLHAVLSEMLQGRRAAELVEHVSRCLPHGFLDDVPDAVLLLEEQLRHGALHALFTNGSEPTRDATPSPARA